jgi:hypothetical protein
MSELHRLIYVSAARDEVTPEGLDSILAAARRNNQPLAVTGLLLFHDGSFFQILEGPKDAVLSIFSMIEKDHRHSRVTVLQSQGANHRAFPSWSMGYMGSHVLRPDQRAQLVDLRHIIGREEQAFRSVSPAVSVHINAFLGSFREFSLI